MEKSNVKPYSMVKFPRKAHMSHQQEEPRREWKCNICMKEFDTEIMLREHEDIHITPFCETCNKMFKTAKLLRLHNQSHHPHLLLSKDYSRLSSSDDELNICEDLSLNKVKEEPIELVSEPEIENLLNHDPHNSSCLAQDISPRSSFRGSQDFYSDSTKSLGIWRNFIDTPSTAFLNIEHSSVPINIKIEPVDVPAESDQFDFIINEILKKPTNECAGTSKLSLVAEEIPLQQNFWTQSEQQIQDDQPQEIFNCDICGKSFSTKQILQRHRIA